MSPAGKRARRREAEAATSTAAPAPARRSSPPPRRTAPAPAARRGPLARWRRGTAPDRRLAEERRRQDGQLLAVLLAVHAVLWLVSDSWLLRLSALAVTALLWPVLVVVVFDRRPSR